MLEISRDTRLVVVGLGYVGLPLALGLAGRFRVIGFDIDAGRIEELRRGHDRTGEVEPARLAASSIEFTARVEDCRDADIYVVTVPTPVDAGNRPDLAPLIAASRTVGRLLNRDRRAIVVFESTVYPGVTENECGPVLEEESGLICGRDFFLGYSPERINPGDREHTVDRIVKVVAGQTPEVTEVLAKVYGAVTTAGIFRARSIKVAEAAKVIENAQRDINIAFMNEISQIFARLDLSIWDVLEAANTKWNFLPFRPGLVGGHCIGVDPYYLSFRALQLGHEPQVILAGRVTNDRMASWVAERVHEQAPAPGSVLVLGLTFKENVPDLRNSKVADVVRRLIELGHQVTVHDPLADPTEAEQEYGVRLTTNPFDRKYDVLIAAIAHTDYRAMDATAICDIVRVGGLVADIPGMWRKIDLGKDVHRWTL